MTEKRVAIFACNIMQLEFEKILTKLQWEQEVIYFDSALHTNPKKMRSALVKKINEVAEQFDFVFLGYGFCQSLEGIEEECNVPVMLPQVDDCISLLLGPKRYAAEVKKETGTWFMTPGWAQVGAQMVIKELHLDRVTKYGKDPMIMAKRLFTHYRRGLFIDTGIGDNTIFLNAAKTFCKDFDLELELTDAEPYLLEEWIKKAYQLAIDSKQESQKL